MHHIASYQVTWCMTLALGPSVMTFSSAFIICEQVEAHSLSSSVVNFKMSSKLPDISLSLAAGSGSWFKNVCCLFTHYRYIIIGITTILIITL